VSESPEPTSASIPLSKLGVAGCIGYAIHAGYHYAHGTPEHAVWVCHVAALLVGAALILHEPRMNAAGLLCLSIGLPMWLLSLASGEPFIWTSPLTHVLGLVLGIIGARAMGFPRFAWLEALAFVFALIVSARLFTPAESNVNLAFGPEEGLSLWSVSGPLHWLLLLLNWAVALFVLDWLWRKALPPPKAES